MYDTRLMDHLLAHELAHIKSSDFVMSTLLLPGTVLTSYAVLRLVSPCECVPDVVNITTAYRPVSKAEQISCSSSIRGWNANLPSTADQPKSVYGCVYY